MGGLINNLPSISTSLKKGFCVFYNFDSGMTRLFTQSNTNSAALIYIKWSTVDAAALYFVQKTNSGYFFNEIYRKAYENFPKVEIKDNGVAFTTSGWANAFVVFFSDTNESTYSFDKVS